MQMMAMSSGAGASSSPCGACKFLRRKCAPECVFAPYFPPDQPLKFSNAHKIFGASNIAKILNDLPVQHRAAAVNSLAYEAQARIKDPVYGCVGAISYLKRHIEGLENELSLAKAELGRYMQQQVDSNGKATNAAAGTLMPVHDQRLNINLQMNDPHIMVDHHPQAAMAVVAAANHPHINMSNERTDQLWQLHQQPMYEAEFLGGGNSLEASIQQHQLASGHAVHSAGGQFLHQRARAPFGIHDHAGTKSPSSANEGAISNISSLSSP